MDPEDIKTYIQGVRSQNRRILSKAITLIESSRFDHQQLAREIVDQLLPYSGQAVRLGITGVPGVGKSIFIESFGMLLVRAGHRVAVHAGLHRGDSGVPRAFGTGVAIQAGDVVVARVQLVGKGDGLRRRIPHREAIRLRGVTDGQHRGKNRNGPEG